MHPSIEEFKDAAIELGLPETFIEKDWYAIQLLKLINEHQFSDIDPIFSGGTSLSKGYGLIKRFSEDLDFKITTTASCGRSKRREYRETIIDLINSNSFFKVDPGSLFKGSQSRHFSFSINYSSLFDAHHSLRSGLKLEMTFCEPKLKPILCPIKSFITESKGEEFEINALCISPIETAADKCAALIWRTHIKDRFQEKGSKYNEPEMIRHLHDLCALEQQIAGQEQQFKCLVERNYIEDKKRGKDQIDEGLNLREVAVNTANLLHSDAEYAKEYTTFVEAVSYAKDDEKIEFDNALTAFKKIIKKL